MNASERAAEINAQARAWMAEDPDRVCGILTEDPDHWSWYGVESGDDLDLYLDWESYREAYKDVHGTRPFGAPWHAHTLEEISTMFESLRCEEEWLAEFEEEWLAEERVPVSEWDDTPVNYPRQDVWAAYEPAQDASPLTHNPFGALEVS